jgi:hypothetical protein
LSSGPFLSEMIFFGKTLSPYAISRQRGATR